MTILFDARRPVKPSRRFGRGILGHTIADETWWAMTSNEPTDRDFDVMAAESAALARLEAGYCC